MDNRLKEVKPETFLPPVLNYGPREHKYISHKRVEKTIYVVCKSAGK